MVVRFVRVIRVPACACVSRVSRVCPGSPRCLFTGTVCTVRSSRADEWGGSGRRQRAEALAERSVEIAQAMVPLAGALARGGC